MGFKRNSLYILIFQTVLFFCVLPLHSQTDTTKHTKYKKQISIFAGMGVSYGTSPSFTTFLKETIPYTTTDSVKTFNIGVEFFGGIEFELSQKFSLRAEYSYFIRSITYTFGYTNFDYFVNMHKPFLMANYLIKKKNYEFELGVGAGYHLANLENDQNQSNPIKYTSAGLGLKGEAVFAAYLSPKFHSYISLFLSGSILGPLKDSNGNNLKSPQTNSDVNLGGLNGGIRLGFSIIL